MAGRERAVDRGARIGRRALATLGAEIRIARMGRGLSQQQVASACRLSQSTIHRIEAGTATGLGLVDLARVLAAVGLNLRAHTVPGASPIRDAGHSSVLGHVEELLPPGTPFPREVPFPNPGDPRAWDALIRLDGKRMGVEAETRPRDHQELLRRMSTKRRDGGVDRLILVLLDSRPNRAFVRAAGSALRLAFPGDQQEAVDALRGGRLPRDDTLLLL